MKPIKTHRCKELLEYNKGNYKPCAIQYDTFFKYFKEEKPTWIFKSLEWGDEWDVEWMDSVAKIQFCPFCGVKLDEIN